MPGHETHLNLPEKIANTAFAASLVFAGAGGQSPSQIETFTQSQQEASQQQSSLREAKPELVPESEVKNWQPDKPYYFWIAYPWGENMKHDGVWRYWNDNGNNPPDTWISDLMPMYDKNGSQKPEDNLYSGQSEQTWEWYMTLSRRANIPITFVENWGEGDRTDDALQIGLTYADSSKNPNPLERLAPYYSNPDKSFQALMDFVNHYKGYAENNPSALRDKYDRGLIIGDYHIQDVDYDYLETLYEVSRQTGVHFMAEPYSWIGIKGQPQDFSDRGSKDPYGWILYQTADSKLSFERNGKTAREISAGYDTFLPTDTRVLQRDPRRYERDLVEMVNNPAESNFLGTADEMGEESALVPAWRVEQAPDGSVIDLANSWGYTYIDILGRRLPPLPVIVPD